MSEVTGTASSEKLQVPDGEYAIVELFGHTTLVGRVAEVERFGTKMLAIEPLFKGTLLPCVFYGGTAIYGMTPCSAEIAQQRQPTRGYQLPDALRAIVPPLLLEAPAPGRVYEADTSDGDPTHDDDDRPF